MKSEKKCLKKIYFNMNKFLLNCYVRREMKERNLHFLLMLRWSHVSSFRHSFRQSIIPRQRISNIYPMKRAKSEGAVESPRKRARTVKVEFDNDSALPRLRLSQSFSLLLSELFYNYNYNYFLFILIISGQIDAGLVRS